MRIMAKHSPGLVGSDKLYVPYLNVPADKVDGKYSRCHLSYYMAGVRCDHNG